MKKKILKNCRQVIIKEVADNVSILFGSRHPIFFFGHKTWSSKVCRKIAEFQPKPRHLDM